MKKTEIFKNANKIGNEITNNQSTGDNVNENIGSDEQELINLSNDSDSDSYNDKDASESTNSYSKDGTNNPNSQNAITYESTNSVSLTSDDVKLLPGTTEYFGTLDIVSILGEKPKYTLQDAKGNYFAYYGSYLDFKDTVETLGGNVYEMVTESEILQNQLFGDRVSYINLSMFKDTWVIMVIKIDGDTRLLQVPSDKYHYSKDYLKSLFIH